MGFVVVWGLGFVIQMGRGDGRLHRFCRERRQKTQQRREEDEEEESSWEEKKKKTIKKDPFFKKC